MGKEGRREKADKKLWGGRFAGPPSEITERISSSIHFDRRLYRQDIRGSIAHAGMLRKIGLLTRKELTAVMRGLREIEREIAEGRFEFRVDREDIHMNIEAALTERVGEAGRKLHTARSRNDQVALDLRLYVRDESREIGALIGGLVSLLAELAARHIRVVMPGYTHMQVAQPVRFSHHLLAHAWALLRDMERLRFVRKECGSLPLGAGALRGRQLPHTTGTSSGYTLDSTRSLPTRWTA